MTKTHRWIVTYRHNFVGTFTGEVHSTYFTARLTTVGDDEYTVKRNADAHYRSSTAVSAVGQWLDAPFYCWEKYQP